MINLFLLCTWSSILIFAWMVKSKYHWTAPPFPLCLLFIVFGILSCVPALACNMFLSRETQFWVYSTNEFNSFMGFLIGAGVSEEFWKMAFGSFAMFLLLSRKKRVKPADCVLGFVSLGLAFAAVENWVAYAQLEKNILISRGLVAIPLHASMGVIHGISVIKARATQSVLPMLLGYLIAVALHTLCDTWNIIIPHDFGYFPLALITTLLIMWSMRQWRGLGEVQILSSR